MQGFKGILTINQTVNKNFDCLRFFHSYLIIPKVPQTVQSVQLPAVATTEPRRTNNGVARNYYR
jgi:hypothetical protein